MRRRYRRRGTEQPVYKWPKPVYGYNNQQLYRIALVVLPVLLTITVAANVVLFLRHRSAEMVYLPESGAYATSPEPSSIGGNSNVFMPSHNLARHFYIASDLYTLEKPPLSQAFDTSLMPVSWDASVFYDPMENRLYISPYAEVIETESNYFFDEHTIRFENATWANRRRQINDDTAYDIQFTENALIIRCNKSCLIEYIEGENTSLFLNGYPYLQLTDPRTLYETIVVVDPGHGGYDFGATVEQVDEKNINLDIVIRLLEAFDHDKIWLYPTRSDDLYITLEDRYMLANKLADYFISVHNNVDERSTRSHGTVTYYHTHETDKPITSEELALRVQAALVERLQTRDRGILYDSGYRLLKNTVIPSVITEVMFMTTAEERKRLSDPDVRQEIALALRDALYSLPPARLL